MCNNYEQLVGWPAFSEIIARLEWRLPEGRDAAALPASASVRVRDLAPVLIASGNAVDLTTMRWGFPPAKPGGPPVFNFRSEGRKFDVARRCLAPASAFFEFTGAKSPKTKHRFTLADGGPFAIAGFWREAAGEAAGAFTLLTAEAGPDVEPYHHRQIIALPPPKWPAWIHGAIAERDLLKASPAGTLVARPNSSR